VSPKALYSFILPISIAPLQVRYYSEALLTQNGYCFMLKRHRSLRGG